MSEQPFKAGDLVCLNSSPGLAMNVVAVLQDGRSIECLWVDDKNEKHIEEFPPEILKHYKSLVSNLDGFSGEDKDRPHISEREY